MGNTQVHYIKLHQNHYKVLQQLKEYNEYKNEYYVKYGYFRAVCGECGSTAYFRPDNYNEYYCGYCEHYVGNHYYYTQSDVIWMFRRKK